MTLKALDWRLILTLAPIGLVFATLTILGTLPGPSATRWVGVAFLAAIGVAAGRQAPARPVVHALLAGLVAAVVAMETQALFLDTYFANNPQYADVEIPFGWSPRMATAVLGPLNGIPAALVAGLFGWLASKLLRRAPNGARNG